MVSFLIERGANINIHTKMGASALYLAVSSCSLDIVKLLLSHGLDPCEELPQKGTAIELAHSLAGGDAKKIIEVLNNYKNARNTVLYLLDIGLQKYVQTFVEQEIDLELLEMMDKDELKNLGLPLGPIVRINKTLQKYLSDL
eukprot:CAMPEP_0174278294 /NCGR_PEP_ID=MMETSP0439-20130205/61398_1 /TAXON_ID=0 /ORGANISM="Stereomyxa ramosa, Strain Chinc5" /LENGTH=141 /DNA_ID=CAMNT_0015370691 /DNA_START=1685 /DNA_END=2110 /DNA_ORIENTATION=+